MASDVRGGVACPYPYGSGSNRTTMAAGDVPFSPSTQPESAVTAWMSLAIRGNMDAVYSD